ncbi:DUF742 domain-containing protein [Streptomyces sp. PTM05]|uniref:DUF742 domain-containing protein n=1 Tax=Streptantibioticus parmotrematis TaxID=2873249 RepID=A0ABS7QPC3_9ACTN|nr:DUF742 domain-containing protein [Streptantibioticus parmotrematis]MBY8884539.1 DUF742 domain-containing protein [Streptantibioticus parmotrematis]
MSESDQAWESGEPERPYVVTRGRSGADDKAPLDLVTLIVSRSVPAPGMEPEQSNVLRLCRSPLSVAEISAYLHLPVSMVSVLVHDLLAEDRVEARSLVPPAQLPDPAIIEAVMYGLQKL